MPSQKILLIDGYNVIHRVPEFGLGLEGGLENARLKLALRVSAWSQNHPATECIIVFDGDIQWAGSRDQRLAGIRCVFSRVSHGGDAEIIRFVRSCKGTSDITVVSDDNNVRNNCRAHGAEVQPTSYVMAGKSRHPEGKAKASADGKGIDRRTAAEIDKELRKKFGL